LNCELHSSFWKYFWNRGVIVWIGITFVFEFTAELRNYCWNFGFTVGWVTARIVELLFWIVESPLKFRIFGMKKKSTNGYITLGRNHGETFWFQQKNELHKSNTHCELATHLDFLQKVDYLLFKYSGTQTETKCCGEKKKETFKEGKHSTNWKKKHFLLRNFTLEFLFFSFFNFHTWILNWESLLPIMKS
jgi:hypothetical protein